MKFCNVSRSETLQDGALTPLWLSLDIGLGSAVGTLLPGLLPYVWAWGSRRGTSCARATSRQASLTSAHRWDWVIFQTPFFLPLWIVRCLRICPIKLWKVYSLPHRLRCYMLMWMRTHGVLKRGKETHFCRRKAVQLFQSRSPRTGWRSFLRIFRVEQNCLFFF